ncbi:MAG: hypothetical protein NTW87_21155, partial [Planctomycetota bacterium]|nr:hypothetical protein [Planctomycetota bacterium]
MSTLKDIIPQCNQKSDREHVVCGRCKHVTLVSANDPAVCKKCGTTGNFLRGCHRCGVKAWVLSPSAARTAAQSPIPSRASSAGGTCTVCGKHICVGCAVKDADEMKCPYCLGVLDPYWFAGAATARVQGSGSRVPGVAIEKADASAAPRPDNADSAVRGGRRDAARTAGETPAVRPAVRPQLIEGGLKRRLLVLRDTLRRACLLDGAGRLVLALVACALAGVLLDYFLFRWERPVNTAFRFLMCAGFLATLGAIVLRRIMAPLSVPLTVDDMALSVEREFPHLNDSLISAVQLTRMLVDDRAVSASMVEEVARKAYQETAALDFSRVVKFDRVKPVLTGAILAAVVFAGLFATPLRPFLATGLARLVNPLSNDKYPVRTQVTVSWEEGRGHEKIVPRNDGLTILADVRGDLPSKARIQFDYGKGFGREELLTPAGTRVDPATGEKFKEFKYDYNPVISSFKFVVLAGDNQTDEYSVRAVDRPELANLLVSYELPPYISDTRSPPKRERSLRNVAGTKAHLQGEVNKPLRQALLKLGAAAPQEMDLSPDRTRFAVTILLDESKDYEIALHDQDGLDNRQNKIHHKIWVLPDALPRVTWRRPATDLEVSPAATVALSLGA